MRRWSSPRSLVGRMRWHSGYRPLSWELPCWQVAPRGQATAVAPFKACGLGRAPGLSFAWAVAGDFLEHIKCRASHAELCARRGEHTPRRCTWRGACRYCSHGAESASQAPCWMSGAGGSEYLGEQYCYCTFRLSAEGPRSLDHCRR